MKHKLSAEPLSESFFSHLNRSHQFVGHVASSKILALDGLYGGPLSATVVEELVHYGIKKVVGYGYAGSLTRTIPIGQIALADAAVVSDGTSREYLPDAEFVCPDRELAHHLRECAAKAGITIRGVKVWITDAIYRESILRKSRDGVKLERKSSTWTRGISTLSAKWWMFRLYTLV